MQCADVGFAVFCDRFVLFSDVAAVIVGGCWFIVQWLFQLRIDVLYLIWLFVACG